MAIPPEDLAIPPEELDTYMFLEDARKTSEEMVAANPLDIHHLTRWGAALFHLSLFLQNIPDAKMMLKEAIAKLEKVVSIKPKKHEALWFLGNAQTSYGFLTSELDIANTYFYKASQCFLKVLAEDPKNDLFLKALKTNAEVRLLHFDILNDGLTDAQQEAGGGSSTSLNAKALEQQLEKLGLTTFAQQEDGGGSSTSLNAKALEQHIEKHGLTTFAQQEAGGGSSTSLNAKVQVSRLVSCVAVEQ